MDQGVFPTVTEPGHYNQGYLARLHLYSLSEQEKEMEEYILTAKLFLLNK